MFKNQTDEYFHLCTQIKPSAFKDALGWVEHICNQLEGTAQWENMQLNPDHSDETKQNNAFRQIYFPLINRKML